MGINSTIRQVGRAAAGGPRPRLEGSRTKANAPVQKGTCAALRPLYVPQWPYSPSRAFGQKR